MTKAKKSKKPTKGNDDRKYVVYTVGLRSTREGSIRCAYVTLDGDRAFVRKCVDDRVADVLPAAHVFKTQTEAEMFLAQKGTLMWIVTTRKAPKPAGLARGVSTLIPCIFEGYVMRYEYGGRHFNERKTAVVAKDGRTDFSIYGIKTFPTKREAVQEYREQMTSAIADASSTIQDAQGALQLLKKESRHT
jgi:hypothetical protein